MDVRRRCLSVLVMVGVVTGWALPASANVDIDDPNVFGVGESWPVPADLGIGDAGPWIVRLQERLVEAGFRPGPTDGRFGPATRGAVYAFEKINGLSRDGSFAATDWDLLDLVAELPESDEPDRVEIDLDRQVLYLVRADQVTAVLPVSSGSGEVYAGRGGSPVRATTPEGSYRFYRHVDGWRISYLGGLYRPFYFRGGYAIHGSTSVPPYPASHGCVRVELHDMDFLTTQLEIGMPIYVYGRRLARDDVIPSPAVETTTVEIPFL